MCQASRTLYGALLLYSLLGSPAVLIGQEPLPTPPQSGTEEQPTAATRRDFYCPTFDNRLLTGLTVDIRPHDAEGELVAATDLPANCMPAAAAEAMPLMLDDGPCRFDWNCRDLLQLARFCHPQLWFEDPTLERYGVDYVCPSFHALGEFTCDLALLPARLLVYKRRPCVRTPTPHCFSSCGVCGY